MKTFYKILTVIAFIFCFNHVDAKSPEVLFDTGETTIFTATKLTYYGLDFSVMQLINPYKMGTGNKILETYASIWIIKFEEFYPQKRIKRLFDVETFLYEVKLFQTVQLEKNSPDIAVAEQPQNLNTQRIEEIVKDYRLDNGSGIGVSIIVQNFHKATEMVSACLTYFDIESRNLLYVVRIYGMAKGMGMEVHWREGLKDMWYDYMFTEYLFARKKVVKEQKRLNRNL
jgi:hypothetical protein